MTGHTKQVGSLAVSPDGGVAASGGWDSTVRFWDLATGHEIRQFARHPGDASSVIWSVTFSHDGRYLLIGCNDKKAILLTVASASEVRSFEFFCRCSIICRIFAGWKDRNDGGF